MRIDVRNAIIRKLRDSLEASIEAKGKAINASFKKKQDAINAKQDALEKEKQAAFSKAKILSWEDKNRIINEATLELMLIDSNGFDLDAFLKKWVK